MHRFFIISFGTVYRNILKPLLFLVSPDTVHAKMLQFCQVFGVQRPARWITKRMFQRYRSSLEQEYYGVVFKSPVGVAAGFDKNGDTALIMGSLGFGFMEVGSVTAARCNGNPRPWFQRLPKTKSLIVNVGLANQGSLSITRRLQHYKPILEGFPVILSVAKTNNRDTVTDEAAIKDYVTSIKRAARTSSIKMIEINISCPNTYGGEPFTDPDRLHDLLTAVDAIKTPQPIFIKMPTDLSWNTFKSLLDVIVRHDIQGVTIANLTKHRSTIKDDASNLIKGGLSGKPTWDSSNALISRTYTSYGNNLTIIGVGGIFTAEDAYIKIRLGASLVELVTGMIFQGPQIAAEINETLPKLLLRDGFSHISEAIGIDAK